MASVMRATRACPCTPLYRSIGRECSVGPPLTVNSRRRVRVSSRGEARTGAPPASIAGMTRDRRTGSTPRYVGLRPASAKASRIASASSRKRDTECEMALRRALWQRGLRYRLAVRDLPGRPDIVFARERVLVFCDGDFWHGRNLAARVRKLALGHTRHIGYSRSART